MMGKERPACFIDANGFKSYLGSPKHLSDALCGYCKSKGIAIDGKPDWFICPCGKRWEES